MRSLHMLIRYYNNNDNNNSMMILYTSIHLLSDAVAPSFYLLRSAEPTAINHNAQQRRQMIDGVRLSNNQK